MNFLVVMLTRYDNVICCWVNKGCLNRRNYRRQLPIDWWRIVNPFVTHLAFVFGILIEFSV